MANPFIHSLAFGLFIILAALVVAVIAIHRSNRKLEEQRRAAKAAPISRPPRKP